MKKAKKKAASPAKAPALGKMVGFIPSHDLDRSKFFYTQLLGFKAKDEDGFAMVLSAPGCSIRVVGVQGFKPFPFTLLGWEVPHIARAVAGLRKRGVVFQHYAGMKQDAQGIWTAPGGARVAWFMDPDGNVLSLTQPA